MGLCPGSPQGFSRPGRARGSTEHVAAQMTSAGFLEPLCCHSALPRGQRALPKDGWQLGPGTSCVSCAARSRSPCPVPQSSPGSRQAQPRPALGCGEVLPFGANGELEARGFPDWVVLKGYVPSVMHSGQVSRLPFWVRAKREGKRFCFVLLVSLWG